MWEPCRVHAAGGGFSTWHRFPGLHTVHVVCHVKQKEYCIWPLAYMMSRFTVPLHASLAAQQSLSRLHGEAPPAFPDLLLVQHNALPLAYDPGRERCHVCVGALLLLPHAEALRVVQVAPWLLGKLLLAFAPGASIQERRPGQGLTTPLLRSVASSI